MELTEEFGPPSKRPRTDPSTRPSAEQVAEHFLTNCVLVRAKEQRADRQLLVDAILNFGALNLSWIGVNFPLSPELRYQFLSALDDYTLYPMLSRYFFKHPEQLRRDFTGGLPADILRLIFSFVPAIERRRAKQVCK